MATNDHSRIDEISISKLRRDVALAWRSFIVLALVPGGAALLVATNALRGEGGFDLQRFYSWQVALPLLAMFFVMLVLRRLTARFNRAALTTILMGYTLLACVAAAVVLWQLSTVEQAIPWDDIGTRIASDGAAQAAIALILGLSLLLLWYAVVTPIGATLRLLRSRLPDGRPVAEVLDGVAPITAELNIPGPSPLQRAGRLVCMGAAAALSIVMVLVVTWLLAEERFLFGLAIEFALLAAIIGLLRLGHRLTAVDAKTLLASDARPPVLFLRSFQDDAGQLEGEWGMVLAAPDAITRSSLGRATRSLLNTSPVRGLGAMGVPRLEEIIAGEVAGLGPFVAIGAPDERLPRLGAARSYFDNETWQTAIIRWIDMAQLIVKVAGPTKWIQWELGHIIEQGALQRLVVVFPKSLTVEDRFQRWHNIANCLAGTPWAGAMSAIDPEDIMALRFKPAGAIQFISGAEHRALDVALAVRILLTAMQRENVLNPRRGAGTTTGS